MDYVKPGQFTELVKDVGNWNDVILTLYTDGNRFVRIAKYDGQYNYTLNFSDGTIRRTKRNQKSLEDKFYSLYKQYKGIYKYARLEARKRNPKGQTTKSIAVEMR